MLRETQSSDNVKKMFHFILCKQKEKKRWALRNSDKSRKFAHMKSKPKPCVRPCALCWSRDLEIYYKHFLSCRTSSPSDNNNQQTATKKSNSEVRSHPQGVCECAKKVKMHPWKRTEYTSEVTLPSLTSSQDEFVSVATEIERRENTLMWLKGKHETFTHSSSQHVATSTTRMRQCEKVFHNWYQVQVFVESENLTRSKFIELCSNNNKSSK